MKGHPETRRREPSKAPRMFAGTGKSQGEGLRWGQAGGVGQGPHRVAWAEAASKLGGRRLPSSPRGLEASAKMRNVCTAVDPSVPAFPVNLQRTCTPQD